MNKIYILLIVIVIIVIITFIIIKSQILNKILPSNTILNSSSSNESSSYNYYDTIESTNAPITVTNAPITVTKALTTVTKALPTVTMAPTTTVTMAPTTTVTMAPTTTVTKAPTTVKPGILSDASYLYTIPVGNLIKTDGIDGYYYITNDGGKSYLGKNDTYRDWVYSLGYDISGFSQKSSTYFVDNYVLNISNLLFNNIKQTDIVNRNSIPSFFDGNRPKYPNVNYPDGTIIHVYYKWDWNYYIIQSGFRRPIGLPNTDYFGKITTYGTLNSYDSFFALPVGTPVNTAKDFNPNAIYTLPSIKPLSFYSIPDGNVITNMDVISWNQNKPNNMWYIDKGMKRYINDLTGSPTYNNNGELNQIYSLPKLGFDNTYSTSGNYSIVLGVPDGSHGTTGIFQYIPTGPDITMANYKDLVPKNNDKRPIFPNGTIIQYNNGAYIIYYNAKYLLSSTLLSKLASPSTNIPSFLCNIFWDPNNDFGNINKLPIGGDTNIITMLSNLEKS